MPEASPQGPRVWLLADGQPGNETQIAGLAAGFADAGAAVETKRVRANRWHMLGTVLLGAGGRSLDRAASDPLEPPWPDLVVGTGRRSAAWTRYVKALSGGRAVAVQLGQKGANYLAGLDRTVALAHWRMPADARRLTIPLPPTGMTPNRLTAAGRALDPAAGPWLLLVVGGRCFDHDLATAEMGALARTAAAEAERLGGALAIVTSRRTGADGEAAMRAAAPAARVFPWQDKSVPLIDLLASADAAIVTGDSESMIAECIAAGLPTYVAPVRPRTTFRMAAERGAARLYGLGGPFRWLVGGLWSGGLLLPPRDLGAMSTELTAAGYVRSFALGAVALDWRPPSPPDLAKDLLALIPPRP